LIETMHRLGSLRSVARVARSFASARTQASRSLSGRAAASGIEQRSVLPLALAVGAATVGVYVGLPKAECAWYDFIFGGKKEENPKWAGVRKAVEELIAKDANYGPLFVRLAWHASGTYDKASGTGGSNGATMRFPPECKHGANNGLNLARDALEPVKTANPDISYADLWTFAGAAAIEYMGGPHIPWTEGRSDKPDGTSCPAEGRLPDASKNAAHIRQIFYRMGFNDREIVALIGAHTLGFCHADRSGYVGPWTRDPYGFDNSFYQLLLSEPWRVKLGSTPLQFEDSTG